MSTTQALLTRIERLEDFVQRLTLGSYIAKAADQGLKVANVPLSSGDQVLARTVKAATKHRTDVAIAEDTLAKAVGNFNDGDALLAYADRNVNDVVTIGVISGHIANGDMQLAKAAVIEHVQRGAVVAKADDMAQVMNSLDADVEGSGPTAVNELAARIGGMERTLSALEGRLMELERRPQNVPAPVMPSAQQTVAKAAGPKRPKITDMPPSAQTKAELLSEINAFVDSPTVVGQLSSMLEAGQIREVQSLVAAAKRSHEERKAINERATWRPSSSLTPR